MSFKDKFSSFFLLEEEDDDEHHKVIEPQKTVNRITPSQNNQVNRQDQQSNIVAMNSITKTKPKIKIIEPRLYSEAKDIADLVLDNQTVILNFCRMETSHASQMLDFMSGVIYSKNGDLQKVGDKMFICAPDSVELDGIDNSSYNK